MLVKFFSRGKGCGSGPVDYLLGKDRARDKAKLLRGDAEQTIGLIDSLSFKKRYTSGALSFSESDISEDLKEKLMDSFEKSLFCGLNKAQYDVLWVEHRDKGRLELNFVVPNVELTSGKRLQPYYDPADRNRINAWQTLVNGSLGFDDPHDPAKERFFSFPSDLPKEKEEASKRITNGLMAMLGTGIISDRQSILLTLKNAGFDITRETKNSISIKGHGFDRPLRLTGKMYERNFKFSQSVREEREIAIRTYQEERKQRVHQAKRTYKESSRRKREEHRKRFPRAASEYSGKGFDTSSVDRMDIRVRHGDGAIDIARTHNTAIEITNNWIRELIDVHERRTAAIVGSITATIYTARKAITGSIQRGEFTSRKGGEPGGHRNRTSEHCRRATERIQDATPRAKAKVRISRKTSKTRERERASISMRPL